MYSCHHKTIKCVNFKSIYCVINLDVASSSIVKPIHCFINLDITSYFIIFNEFDHVFYQMYC